MTRSANIPAIEKATGRAWSQWVEWLEAHNAKELTHTQIAELIYPELKRDVENYGWWAQGVTIAYEQHIGRRAPGQRADGSYELSVTRTIGADMDDAMQKWLDYVEPKREFHGQKLAGEPSMSSTPRRRHWAVNLADGTRVSADTNLRNSGAAMIAVTHAKLTSAAAASEWRAFWKQQLEKL